MISFNVAERVAPTAKLAGMKGSKKQRAQFAKDLNARFFGMVSDSFEKRGEVSQKEIRGFFKKLCPQVKLAIVQNRGEDYDGALNYIVDSVRGITKGFILELPLIETEGKQVIKKEGLEDLLHETRHLFDDVTDSTSLACKNNFPLSSKFKDYNERGEQYNNFYTSELYAFELTDEGIEEIKKNPSMYIQIRKTAIKKGLERIFDKPEITSEEKIETLEYWRHHLATELNAHSDGITYRHKFEEAHPYCAEDEKPKQSLGEKIKEKVDVHFFFRGKIEVIEELLAEELTKIRNNHRDSLIQRGKIKADAHPEHQVEAIAKMGTKSA